MRSAVIAATLWAGTASAFSVPGCLEDIAPALSEKVAAPNDVDAAYTAGLFVGVISTLAEIKNRDEDDLFRLYLYFCIATDDPVGDILDRLADMPEIEENAAGADHRRVPLLP